MLKRLYADNFCCLVNFNLEFERLALLLGDNGAGKSTVFSLIHRLQWFMLGRLNLSSAFPSDHLTRWQKKNIQNFELELQIDQNLYLYQLDVDHKVNGQISVKHEQLSVDNRTLFIVQDGLAKFPGEDGKLMTGFPFDPELSVVGSFLSGAHNDFKREVEKIIICVLQPMNIAAISDDETPLALPDMSNFVSWYRYISQEYQGTVFNLIRELREVLPRFHSFSLREVGENAREMRVQFQTEDQVSSRTSYQFNELSDGQRVLIILYTLLYGLEDRGAYLFLDEPENFVALREIQPWLTALTDTIGGGIKQAVIISHHPEVINYLGATSGRWFERTANGPARVNDKPPGSVGALLPLSETIARGWEK